MTALAFTLSGTAIGLILAGVLEDKRLIGVAACLVLLTSVALMLAERS